MQPAKHTFEIGFFFVFQLIVRSIKIPKKIYIVELFRSKKRGHLFALDCKKKSFLQGYDKKETFTTRHSIDTNYQSARKLTKMTQLVKDKLGIFSEEKKCLEF